MDEVEALKKKIRELEELNREQYETIMWQSRYIRAMEDANDCKYKRLPQ